MSYSRTYRHVNGVEMNRASLHGDQRGRQVNRTIIDGSLQGGQGRSETGEGSGVEHGDRRHTEEKSRHERRDGFTMFRPDEKKRTHLLEVAKRETEAAQARSDARQVRHIHERPRRLGGTTDYFTTVNQKQKAVTGASKGLEVQKKREKWQREKRERDERENQEKKAKARAQAERNEVLQAVRAQEMMERNREAHRW